MRSFLLVLERIVLDILVPIIHARPAIEMSGLRLDDRRLSILQPLRPDADPVTGGIWLPGVGTGGVRRVDE